MKKLAAAILVIATLAACERKYAPPPKRMSVSEFQVPGGARCVEIIYSGNNIVVTCSQISVDKLD
jgi:hypothetical protein